LTVYVEQVAIRASKLLSLSRRFKISFEEQFLLWFMMAKIHYNRPKTLEKRKKIIALWTSGSKQAQIAEEVGLSPQTVSNIVNKFRQRWTYFPGKPGLKERTVFTPDIVEFVEYSKLTNPRSYTSEIRQALIRNGICAAANAPSRLTSRATCLRRLQFARLKLSIKIPMFRRKFAKFPSKKHPV